MINLVDRQFMPGQRWVSSTESELGLGIVTENSGRRVTLRFPAADEERTYAVDNAPLSRVEYEVGEQVSTLDGRTFTVTERRERDGRLRYVGIDNDGVSARFDEGELSSAVAFGKPQDRLFAGQIDKNALFELRAETLAHQHAHQRSAACGLLGARVQLLPHQLYIASQVAKRHAPRVLLADEVGLGKTIEAGLILHQQLVTGRASRIVILVPDALVHQWLVEMLRRFNLQFSVLDEERCAALEESGTSNPFESAQLVLCALSLVIDHPQRHAQAAAARWDVLVVDEAHHLSFDEQGPSQAYGAIEALAQRAAGLLLLTATPEQLGADGHFARLRLLDAARYYDLDAFREQELRYRPLGALVESLLANEVEHTLRCTPALLAEVRARLGAGAAARLEAAAGDAGAFAQAMEHVVDDLLDRHGTGRVLFRNTRGAVGGFPERRLRSHPLPAPSAYRQRYLAKPVGQLLHPETLLGDEWPSVDPRVAWLVDWLRAHRDEKVLIICARADTAAALETHLRLRAGIRSAVFHEGLTLIARDRAAAYFADEHDSAQALVCSEIGSEGRNFQFAHNLVLLDLPLNPDLLEQRIGRLDRIGQKRAVEIHVPFYEGSAQAVLLRWYDEGLNAFAETFPAGERLLQSFSQPLTQCLTACEDATALDVLVANTRAKAQAIRQALKDGRDRLLEQSSCRPGRAAEVIRNVANAVRTDVLADYMERLFDHVGVELQVHGAHSVIVRPGNHMICESLPGLPEDGLTATYRRAEALSREDMQFLTWEHPLVAGAMDMILAGEFGNTALCTIKLPPFKPGTLLLEAFFAIQCAAPKSLQLERYLNEGAVRLVVDASGADFNRTLSVERLSAAAKRVPGRTAEELVRQARGRISALIAIAERLAEPKRRALAATAVEEMLKLQGAEVERLEALAEVNANIRRDEIEHARATMALLQHHLAGARLRLDALRVILAVA